MAHHALGVENQCSKTQAETSITQHSKRTTKHRKHTSKTNRPISPQDCFTGDVTGNAEQDVQTPMPQSHLQVVDSTGGTQPPNDNNQQP